MAKNSILKKISFGLLLAVCFAVVLSAPVQAGVFDNYHMDKVCDKWSENISDYSGQDHCWACQIFMLVFDSCNTVCGQVNEALGGPLSSLIAIGGGIWMVFYTLSFLNNFSGPDPYEYLTQLGRILLRVIFGYLFIQNGCAAVFEYVINPVLTSGVKLANQTIALTNSGLGSLPSSVNTSASSGPFDAGVRDALKSMIEAIASSMAESQAIATGLRCGGMFWIDKEFFGMPIVIPNPLMIATGGFLGCIFWGVAILFSFAMIDVIFRIGLLIGLLPIFVAAWVFPITKSYAKSGWDMFLQSTLVFFITGITASFITILVKKAWETGADNTASFVDLMKTSEYVEAWNSLFAQGLTSGFGTLFLVMCVAYWAWSMAPKADKTAKEILGGTFSSSCAIKAIKKMIETFNDLVMGVISIITVGIGTCIYIVDLFKYMKRGADIVKKAQEILKKLREIREKMEKVQERMKKMQDMGQKMAKVMPKIEEE